MQYTQCVSSRGPSVYENSETAAIHRPPTQQANRRDKPKYTIECNNHVEIKWKLMREWLQLQFDFDSTLTQLRFHCNSSAIRVQKLTLQLGCCTVA